MNRKAGVPRKISTKNGDLHIPEPVSKLVEIGGKPNGHGTGVVATNDSQSRRVLSEEQVVETLRTCQQHMLSLVPKAITAYAAALDADDPRTKLTAATKLLEGVGLFRGGGIEQVLETTAAADQMQEERRFISLGVLFDMVLNKSEMYMMPHPQEFVDEVREVAKRVEEHVRQVGIESTDSGERAAPAKNRVRLTPSASRDQISL